MSAHKNLWRLLMWYFTGWGRMLFVFESFVSRSFYRQRRVTIPNRQKLVPGACSTSGTLTVENMSHGDKRKPIACYRPNYTSCRSTLLNNVLTTPTTGYWKGYLGRYEATVLFSEGGRAFRLVLDTQDTYCFLRQLTTHHINIALLHRLVTGCRLLALTVVSSNTNHADIYDYWYYHLNRDDLGWLIMSHAIVECLHRFNRWLVFFRHEIEESVFYV